MKGKACFILTALILTAIQAASAADEDPYAIIDMVEERQNAVTGKSEISMLVYPDINDKGNHRDMRLLSYSRGQDESYMEFITPKSIQGLRILSVDGNQWVYFPSTGRVRKIASKSKDESVSGVGGDFSYEDLGGGTMREKYNLFLKESSPGTWVIEGLAKEKD
ncbi:MAG: outer membrane lipoprotein-sorting protein, partial [Spirochaetota bacterium]